jgi:magnesium transporter
MLEQRVALVRLRQRAAPQRDLLHVNAHLVQQLPGLDVDDDHDRLRDVHDHLVTTVQRIDAISDILASALQLHLAMVATDQAEVSRRLTGVATIFLPLSVVVGFFGMNFGWLVDHIDTWQAFVGYGLLGGAACTAGLLLYVRKLTRESTSADDG